MDNYFDLHLHPLAKNHLANSQEKPSKDIDKDSLTQALAMSKAFKDYTDETVLRTVESQCCIDYLRAGKVHLGIAAIAALEFGVASSKGFVADILKSNLKKPLDDHYFEAVREGEVSYLNLFLREVELYRVLRDIKTRKPPKKGSIHLLKRFTNPKEQWSDKLLNIVFAIEGGHNLCMKKIGNALDYDDFEGFKDDEFFDPGIAIPEDHKDPATVLEKLVRSFQEYGLDILYLTLTHLTHIPEQHLATHAFATKALKHPSFYPFGNGLTEMGKDVIERAYELQILDKKDKTSSNGVKDGKGSTTSAPVLIDIAHMSLKSRQDLYDFRKRKGYDAIPLIASHVGVTGYSVNDWKYNLETKKCVNHVDQGIKTVKIHTRPKVAGYWGSSVKKEFTFNPNTINLMDEDILEVVHSNGIIGVSLDVNILGNECDATSEIDTSEFITTADFLTHFPYTSLQSLEYADTEEIRSAEAWLEPVKKEMHPLGFCFNIVHLLAVIGLKTNAKKPPEKYICVGSDFDGFITPLRVCSDSRRMKDLESNLLKWLPVAVKRYQKENGGTDDLFEFAKKKKDLEKVVEAILYGNGRDFMAQEFVSKSDKEKKLEPAK